MKRACAALVWCFVAAVVCLQAVFAEIPRVKITVNVGEVGPKLGPLHYGIFFEEINHAGDGGLYAELVRNRSFEEGDTPVGWQLLVPKGASASWSIDKSLPINKNNPSCLRLDVSAVNGGRVAVFNEGYWGLPVKKGAGYRCSFYARSEGGFAGPIHVSLEGKDGKVYASTEVKRVSAVWKKFRCALVSKAEDDNARLVLSVSSPGRVFLDMVSLFPEKTYKRRANGLRPDLVKMLADMRPSFCRFPGGCFVEGDRIANAFRWKQTIGDPAARKTHWNLWGYYSTNGLGFHEYLQLCEDLRMEPVFVINCGMAHEDVVPMEKIDEWVQDALDAIEYANGSTSTTWGALRAANGHPKPFNLKFIEIGNENSGPAYEERYARFYDAIKARYPQIKIIANVPVKSRPVEILDEHYYSTPEWFMANSTRYDKYDRKGPKIYVGEYAVTQRCGKGNLLAAVAEAAFMIGMERNADVVQMASYAPLFVNVNDRRWNPDAICFDATRVYGTPSYHVQKLFSRNRGDVVLGTQVIHEVSGQLQPIKGGVGVGTWATQAEFANIKVVQGSKTLLEHDFSGGMGPFEAVSGAWEVKGGVLRQTSGALNCRVLAANRDWSDYSFSLRARKLGGREGFLIIFGASDPRNLYWWNIGGWGNTMHAVEKETDGLRSIIGDSVPGRIEENRWYDIRVSIRGRRIQCYLDGKLVHDFEDAPPPKVVAVATKIQKTGEILIKAVNFSAEDRDAVIEIRGVRRLKPYGTAIVLTSKNPEDENSFEEPNKVAPVTRRLSGVSTNFQYRMPPWSVNFLKVAEAK